MGLQPNFRPFSDLNHGEVSHDYFDHGDLDHGDIDNGVLNDGEADQVNVNHGKIHHVDVDHGDQPMGYSLWVAFFLTDGRTNKQTRVSTGWFFLLVPP